MMSDMFVVFDFDCTLTVRHMHGLLRTPDGYHRLTHDKAGFYNDVFGGAVRIKALKQMLRSLQQVAGIKLFIVSFGYEHEILDALNFYGLVQHFSRIMGSDSFGDHCTSKLDLIHQQIAPYKQTTPSLHSHLYTPVLFVDDDIHNFPQGERSSSRAQPPQPQPPQKFEVFKCKDKTLPSKNTIALVAYPVKGGRGLTCADMKSITTYVHILQSAHI